jgi:hypothetical protein
LPFVAGILMMARLEAMQTDMMTCAGRADQEPPLTLTGDVSRPTTPGMRSRRQRPGRTR